MSLGLKLLSESLFNNVKDKLAEAKAFLDFLRYYLKDVYSLPKSKGWDIAKQILDYFGIDNENPQ